MILIYITCKDKAEAIKISNILLKKKLVACTNIFPITSMYHWKAKIQNDKEIVLLAKTKNSLYNKIKQEVKSIHSYETPCILKLKAKANKEYEDWINKECI